MKKSILILALFISACSDVSNTTGVIQDLTENPEHVSHICPSGVCVVTSVWYHGKIASAYYIDMSKATTAKIKADKAKADSVFNVLNSSLK